MQIDLRIAELLASRLCHDLVGPIGAVNNGMELLADDEFGMADDAMQLASSSARRASDSLQFFRMAYGMAGNRVGGDLRELRKLSEAHLKSSKASLDWPDGNPVGEVPDGLGKLLLNMLEFGLETLPRGGTLSVGLAPAGNGASGITAEVVASGAEVQLRPEVASAIATDVKVEDLSPRNVQGYFTRLLAQRLGGDLQVEGPDGGRIRFSVSF